MLIDEVLHAFGRLDVWVCSSGLLGPPSSKQLPDIIFNPSKNNNLPIAVCGLKALPGFRF